MKFDSSGMCVSCCRLVRWSGTDAEAAPGGTTRRSSTRRRRRRCSTCWAWSGSIRLGGMQTCSGRRRRRAVQKAKTDKLDGQQVTGRESGAAVFALLRSFVLGAEAPAPFDVVCHVPAFSNDRPPFPTLLARLSTSDCPAFGARQILSISRGPLVPGQSTALHSRSARTAVDRVSWPSLRPRSSGISTAPEWAHKGVR